VARPTTHGRTFTPIKPLTNAEITALQERAVNMYTGSTKPAAATLTESGLGLQVPMFGGDGGGDGVGNSSTGGPGPSASAVGSGIAQGIAAANSMGVLGAIADPMGALTAYAVHAALSPTLSAPEDAAPITSVSETSPGVGSGGFSSATGIAGFGDAADAVGGANSGSMGTGIAGFGDAADAVGGANSGGGGGGDSGVGMGADAGAGVFKAGGYVNYAGGGMVNPAQQASGLAALGRGKDSMLVHMTPSEVQGLQAMAQQQGESLTTNPYTGLPEAGKLEDFLKKAAPILPFIIPGAGAVLGGLAGQAMASGIIAGFAAPGKGFNFSKGLQTGLLAYGLGSAYNSMNPNAPIGGPTGGTGGKGGTGSVSVGGPSNVASSFGGVDVASSVGGDPIYGQAELLASNPPISLAPPPATVATATTAATDTATKVDPSKTKFEQFTGVSPTTALIGGNLAVGAYQADKEMGLAKQQLAAVQAEEERKRALARESFERSLGRVNQPTYAAKGGLMSLARGGMPTFEYGGTTAQTGEPRMVKGAGDGMSDNVPASIEGVQEARLANDEFVVPADVVADIGNGSSSAGAKKLYAMMDRIRTARHGTTDQPPAIKAEKYMPA
jgi:hypothetical protein